MLEAVAAIEKRITTLEGISALPWGGRRVGVTVTVTSIALAIFLVACWSTLAFWNMLLPSCTSGGNLPRPSFFLLIHGSVLLTLVLTPWSSALSLLALLLSSTLFHTVLSPEGALHTNSPLTCLAAAATSSILTLTLTLTLTLLSGLTAVALARFKRPLYICLLFAIVFGSYITVKTAVKVFRLSSVTDAALHRALDSLFAPFLAEQAAYLNSIFIKIGQNIATRHDLVSGTWTKALSCLHDSCPQSSERHVRELIESAFGMGGVEAESGTGKAHNGKRKSVEEIFESFDWIPVASASIGQVHFATLRPSDGEGGGGGKEVVVKVQHEDIGPILRADLALSLRLARIVAIYDVRWKVSNRQFRVRWREKYTGNTPLLFPTRCAGVLVPVCLSRTVHISLPHTLILNLTLYSGGRDGIGDSANRGGRRAGLPRRSSESTAGLSAVITRTCHGYLLIQQRN